MLYNTYDEESIENKNKKTFKWVIYNSISIILTN